jgi:hypothetical protein
LRVLLISIDLLRRDKARAGVLIKCGGFFGAFALEPRRRQACGRSGRESPPPVAADAGSGAAAALTRAPFRATKGEIINGAATR